MLEKAPFDVLLEIVLFCGVDDILRLESTCKALRNVVAARPHWLYRLRSLSAACAPDIPANVKIEHLQAAELRELVLRAVRTYRNLRYGGARRGSQKGTSLVIRGCMPHERYGRDISFLPGGKLFFLIADVAGMGDPVGKRADLMLREVSQDSSVIWSYLSNYDAIRIRQYAFHVRSDGSIRLVVQEDARTVRTVRVLDLVPNASKGYDTKLLWHVNMTTHNCVNLFMGANFAIITHDCSAKLLVINTTERWQVILHLGESSRFQSLHMKNDTLICVEQRQLQTSSRRVFILHAAGLGVLKKFVDKGILAWDDLKNRAEIVLDGKSDADKKAYNLYDLAGIATCDYARIGKPGQLGIVVYGLGSFSACRDGKTMMAFDVTLTTNECRDELVLSRRIGPVESPFFLCSRQYWSHGATHSAFNILALTYRPTQLPLGEEIRDFVPAYVGLDEDGTIFFRRVEKPYSTYKSDWGSIADTYSGAFAYPAYSHYSICVLYP